MPRVVLCGHKLDSETCRICPWSPISALPPSTPAYSASGRTIYHVDGCNAIFGGGPGINSGLRTGVVGNFAHLRPCERCQPRCAYAYDIHAGQLAAYYQDVGEGLD